MADKAKAAVLYGVGDIRCEEYDKPEVYGNMVLVRIERCAICTWDQRVYTGENKPGFPFIGGHEAAGYIEAMGPDVDTRSWAVGDMVAVAPASNCGDCFQCRTGHSECCANFVRSPQLPGLPHNGTGGFAQYLLMPASALYKLYNVTPAEGAIVEPVSCVLHSVQSANVQPGDYVLVIGCGIMGQLHTQVARAKGACVIVSDTNEERAQLACQYGASYAVNPAKENVAERVLELTHGRKCQAVFDTTPFPAVLDDAYACVANAGCVVLYSSIHPKPGDSKYYEMDPGWMHSWSIKTIGTANSNPEDFTRAAAMISEGIVDVKPFLSASVPVEQCHEAMEQAILPTTFRVLLEF